MNEDFIIYLEGDILGKSSKAKGHKTIVAQLAPTTVEAGTYSGKLKLTVDKSGRVTSLETVPEVDVLNVITSQDGIMYVEEGILKYVSKEQLVPKQEKIVYPVTSVNGETGDVVIEMPEFKQEYKAGDYHIKQISGVSLGAGVLKSDGETVFTEPEVTPTPVVFTITGDMEGSGTDTVEVKLKTVPVSKGGTGATTKEESMLNLWPTESNGIVVRNKDSFIAVSNKGAKSFFTQENGETPKFSAINIHDIPQLNFDKIDGVLPVSKGGVNQLVENGFVVYKNGEYSTVSMPVDLFETVMSSLKDLRLKVESLEAYTKNVELSLGDQIKKLNA